MDYFCHVALGCYFEFLDKLQKPNGNSLATSFEPLALLRNVTSLSLFCRYYFGRCVSELAQLVPLPYSEWRSTCYFDNCLIFLSPFLNVTSADRMLLFELFEV